MLSWNIVIWKYFEKNLAAGNSLAASRDLVTWSNLRQAQITFQTDRILLQAITARDSTSVMRFKC